MKKINKKKIVFSKLNKNVKIEKNENNFENENV